MKKVQSLRGFTLTEFVFVIVILGILAAVAAPRVLNLSHDARSASIVYAAGVIKATAGLVNDKVKTSGATVTATVSQLTLGPGNTLDIQNGYPACTVNGIVKATNTLGQFTWYTGGGGTLCTLYPNLGRDSSGATIYNPTCGVVYDSSTGSTWTPVTSGC